MAQNNCIVSTISITDCSRGYSCIVAISTRKHWQRNFGVCVHACGCGCVSCGLHYCSRINLDNHLPNRDMVSSGSKKINSVVPLPFFVLSSFFPLVFCSFIYFFFFHNLTDSFSLGNKIIFLVHSAVRVRKEGTISSWSVKGGAKSLHERIWLCMSCQQLLFILTNKTMCMQLIQNDHSVPDVSDNTKAARA